MSPDAATPVDMTCYEKHAYRRGYRCVTGIDEVGRGPLAGPVVAAAVVLPEDALIPGVKDSKLLSPLQREICCRHIRDCALDVGIGLVEAAEIDRINVLQATFKAMIMAVQNLRRPPDYLLIDGPYKLPLSVEQEGIVGGDRLSISIACASVVAKVHRDALMCEYHELYPAYGFDRNKGYGTARHIEAIQRCGPCSQHRMSFKGVAGS
jgi:ribonuclease HII